MRYLSLFSGMEAAHIAWTPLGWECAGVAEIEPAACALLRHRLPDVPNLGDVSKVTGEAIAKLGRIDVVIGGSPCQDLSVAGKRAGLSGSRSSLFHEQLRIFNAARTLCGARWLVWENVPGAFSSNKGRDFAVVAGAMAGCQLAVPAEGWGNEGVALGDNGLVEWSVLDSQWFGVAQRRRRVFAVLDTGDWANRPPVLLESDRLRGDSAPSREAGEGSAGGAVRSVALRGREGGATAELGDEVGGTLRASGGGGDKPYALVPSLARCLTTGDAARLDGESCTFIPETCGTICADSHYTGQDAYTDRLIPAVAHTLRADGFDASEDGTGRGTPLVPCYAIQAGALRTNPESGPDGVGVQSDLAYTLEARAEVQCVAFSQNQRDEVRLMEVAGALAAEPGMKQQTYIAFGCKDSDPARSVSDDVATTLRAMGHADSHANAGGQVAVAFQPGNLMRGAGSPPSDAVFPTLKADHGRGWSDQHPHVMTQMQVRRLTPIECERLQAAPDNWTLVPNAKGKPMADGPRYRLLGNSFTSTVVRWVGIQIDRASKYHCHDQISPRQISGARMRSTQATDERSHDLQEC